MSLVITTACSTEDCGGRVRFSQPRKRRSGRLTGRCDACGRVFDLYGGELRRFDLPLDTVPDSSGSGDRQRSRR